MPTVCLTNAEMEDQWADKPNEFSSSKFNLSMCVCLCVCVCVCVCVCLYLYSFTVKASSVCNDVWGIFDEYWSTILCCKYFSSCLYQVPSSPFPKMSYFNSKDGAPAGRQTGHGMIQLATCLKIIYIHIGYKSAPQPSRQVTKKY